MRHIDENVLSHLWLNRCTGFQVRWFRRVQARFPDLREAYAAAEKKQLAAFDFLPDKFQIDLIKYASMDEMNAFIDRMEKKSISFALPHEESYPALLKEIADPPSVLYRIGRYDSAPALALAVVGSRKPTLYGREIAERFSHAFASVGATVISGMAEGVDACAARGALDAEGAAFPTVAVLGTGVDVVYPPSNRRLYDEIIERGAVVSEFLPGSRAERIHFPIRNRVMSGMAHGTLVVEAAERSGTSITADFAHEQGREVFAIPGRITDALSVGPNRMVARGEAKPVLTPNDVLEEFACPNASPDAERTKERVSLFSLASEEQSVARLLKSGGEMSFDELADALPIPTGLLNAALTSLAFSGIVAQRAGRIYALEPSVLLTDD